MQRAFNYFPRGSMTVQFTYYFTCLVSAALIMLKVKPEIIRTAILPPMK